MLLLKGRHPETGEIIIPESVIDYVATGHNVYKGKAAYPELSPTMYGAGQSILTYQGHQVRYVASYYISNSF